MTVPMQALCCQCGSIRTCRRPRNHKRENYWLREPVDPNWHRETGELKCAECGRVTTHAIVLPDDILRDHAEKIHLVATGWTFRNLNDHDRQRIRARYRQGLPRNPYLRHSWWTSDERAAREAGKTHFKAICHAEILVPETTSEERGTSYRHDELVAPNEFHDVDREDPETGLWWFDIDCVDCLRRSNQMAVDAQRKALTAKLQDVVGKVATLDPQTVAELLANFGGGEGCDS